MLERIRRNSFHIWRPYRK